VRAEAVARRAKFPARWPDSLGEDATIYREPTVNVTADNVARYEQPPMQLFRGERQLLDRYLAPDMRVLDLGSGSGRVTKHIAAAGARVWACDLNATALQVLRRSLHPSSVVSVILADARELPVPDCSFDMVVFAFNGIDFLHPESERFRALEEISRVLRPGGYFVFSSHNRLGMLLTPRGLRSRNAWRWRLRFALSGIPTKRYFLDTNGLLLYQAVPAEVVDQVNAHGGFRFLCAQNRSGHVNAMPLISLFSAWPSYVFIKEGFNADAAGPRPVG